MKIFLSLLFFLSANTYLNAQEIKINKLTALNLEEDKGPFATLNDEILLISASYHPDMDTLVTWQYSKILVLSDSISVAEQPFSQSLSLDSSLNWLFIVLELDSKLDTDEISSKIRSVFEEYAAYPSTLLKEKIRLQTGDDDLLGFFYLNAKQRQKLGSTLKIKGMHMFNRYEYEVVLFH